MQAAPEPRRADAELLQAQAMHSALEHRDAGTAGARAAGEDGGDLAGAEGGSAPARQGLEVAAAARPVSGQRQGAPAAAARGSGPHQQGMPVARRVISGSAGRSRWEKFTTMFILILILVLVTMPLLVACALVEHHEFIVVAPILVLAIFIFFIYNLSVPGPWRCCDASAPVHFELSAAGLTVQPPIGYCGLRRAREIRNIAEVETIGVYCETTRFTTWMHRRWWQRQGVVHDQRPYLQLVQSEAQAKELLPTLFSPLDLLRGTRADFTCAFLGVRFQGEPEVLPLSLRIWHRGGLKELYKLRGRVHAFQEGVAERAKGMLKPASEETLAALPRRCYHRAGMYAASLEAQEFDDCAICLETMQEGDHVALLPCGHIFHGPCVESWLRVCGRCPTCKHVVGMDDVEASGKVLKSSLDSQAHVASGVILEPIV